MIQERFQKARLIKTFALAVGAVSFGLTSCNWKVKPTFPSAGITSSLQRMCSREYKMSVKTHRQGATLQVFFWRLALLKDKDMEMRPEAAEALEEVLLCATRVALSTDAPLQFIEVKMADLTGATVTLWRYVPDIRDSMNTRMSEDEYINRLVMEVDTDDRRPGAQREVTWDPPLTMEQFLAKQVVLRAKRQSPIGLQLHEDLSKPQTLGVVIDNWALIEKQDPDQEDKVADAVEKSAKTVFLGYGYKGFHDVTMRDSQGGLLKSWKF